MKTLPLTNGMAALAVGGFAPASQRAGCPNNHYAARRAFGEFARLNTDGR